MEGAKNIVKFKLVHMAQSEWEYLHQGWRQQNEVRQLLKIRNSIQDECERLISNLDE